MLLELRRQEEMAREGPGHPNFPCTLLRADTLNWQQGPEWKA
jgi:hypothetical protein